ncbi:PIN2/TERF1-interacting telomerase inhibitor 1 isoform X2 [Protopterus annectens]|uniref:PIN2/TERF1-interacting telomerase inhibitor 1 isoform X2 n=1 Tax=Protopterus annectens TaxID=7888 RepID=UPI001CFB4D48|nr:PIN2/TERF1-interacting telomerase inhibitor 1 isoform X2 [Protopterus annectens]
MAMLAEPRRKQKWSVDPRNNAWSKDDSKYGQKLMEKMGWSKGKGLGAKEQGATEHIKVKLKNDNLGLGATVSHEDNWLAHQDDFNQLLAELNSCHGQNDSESAVTDSQETFSLEKKSKSCKKRVHYMKFTKGKDLSCRTETDLACIFGKRKRHAEQKSKVTETHQSESACSTKSLEDGEEKKESVKPQVDYEQEIIQGKTVTSSLTVQEYFAKRMAILKKAHTREEQDLSPSIETSVASLSPKESKLKKKKQKKKEQEKDDSELVFEDSKNYDEDSLAESNCSSLQDSYVDPDCHPIKKKKKKKDKNKGDERNLKENISILGKTASEDLADNFSQVNGTTEQCWEEKQKKRKKLKQKEETETSEYLDGHSIHLWQPLEGETSKKGKKKKKYTE